MLKLLLGRAGTGRTEQIRRRILDGIAAGKSGQILLVPEQFSFESERALLQMGGERAVTSAEVLSFPRLCLRVFQQYGGMAGQRIDDSGRMAMMGLALEQSAAKLQIYGRLSSTGELTDELLRLLSECKRQGITPDALRSAAAQLPLCTLRRKAEEIALIFESYESLLNTRYVDPDDDLTHLLEILPDCGFFTGRTIYVDSFSGFSDMQLRLLCRLLPLAEDVVISLCTDSLSEHGESDLFLNIKRTAARLIDAAHAANVPVAAPEILTRNLRAESPSIAAVEQILSAPSSQTYPGDGRVVICTADTLYDECDYVARTICSLVRTEKIRCRHIAVIARDISQYDGIIDGALARYGIPCFMDTRRPAGNLPLPALTAAGVTFASGNYDFSVLLTGLKTGLCGLDFTEVSELENYCTLWGLSGSQLRLPFTANPLGVSERFGPAEEAELARLNQLRETAVTPFFRLCDAVKSAHDTKDFSTAVWNFLNDCQAAEHLRALAEKIESEGNIDLAEDLRHTHDLICGLLDQITAALSENSHGFAEYARLFLLALQSLDMGRLPQGIDEVCIGSADRIRPARPDTVFLLGCYDGGFPAAPSRGGIFTDSERTRLVSMGLSLDDRSFQAVAAENYLFYSSACAASRRLYLCLPLNGKENMPLTPSAPLLRLMNRLPGCMIRSERDSFEALPEQAQQPGPALEALARGYFDPTPGICALRRYFETDGHCSQYDVLRRSTTQNVPSLSPQAVNALYPSGTSLSPSGIENYFRCRYSYFCQYALHLAVVHPVVLDGMQRGLLSHSVLEQLLQALPASKLAALPDDELRHEIHKLVYGYIEEQMGGVQDKPARFLYRANRLEEVLFAVIRVMAQELSDSRFEPTAFELAIGPKGRIPPLTLSAGDAVLTITGKVDRIDTYQKDDTVYFRVIDYKTGTREFKLEEVFAGVSLQLLLYLLAVSQQGRKLFANGGELVPAGLFYLPVNLSVEGDDPDNKPAMCGLILNDDTVLSAMDPEKKGYFLPITYRDGTIAGGKKSLASERFFEKIQPTIEKRLSEMWSDLQSGSLSPEPLQTGRFSPCVYCKFRSACPRRDFSKGVTLPTLGSDQYRQILEGEF